MTAAGGRVPGRGVRRAVERRLLDAILGALAWGLAHRLGSARRRAEDDSVHRLTAGRRWRSHRRSDGRGGLATMRF